MPSPLTHDLLKQAEAANSNKAIYKSVYTFGNFVDFIVAVTCFVYIFFTYGLSILAFLLYCYLRGKVTPNLTVKNVATGEKFRVNRKEYFNYRRRVKKEAKQIKHLQ